MSTPVTLLVVFVAVYVCYLGFYLGKRSTTRQYHQRDEIRRLEDLIDNTHVEIRNELKELRHEMEQMTTDSHTRFADLWREFGETQKKTQKRS